MRRGSAQPLAVRFEAKVDRSGGPDACHPWTGGLFSSGYGRFCVGVRSEGTTGLSVGAHQWAYEQEHGPVPMAPYGHRKLDLDHTCHNTAAALGACLGGRSCLHRRCCNPRHLRVTTIIENVAASSLAPANRTHCPRGHAYDEQNTYHRKRGRGCRACRRLSARKA